MGYPVPSPFQKTQPRFPGQDLDVYVQKADNLQIWNEEITPTHRYALIRLNQHDQVVDVRIVTGEEIALLDKTGTLTQKYQAKRRSGNYGSRLVSALDTPNFQQLYQPLPDVSTTIMATLSPTERPRPRQVLDILSLYRKLELLIGQELLDVGADQERNRGAALHRLICQTLGLGRYADRGQFPDIVSQALEIKLQTSPTIDLGLVSPDSQEPAETVGQGVRHCDVRYAVIYAMRLDTTHLQLTDVVVTTGHDFFSEFQRFEGMVRNIKIQIPLPASFFRETE